MQVEKQRGHLAAYHGLSKTEDQAIDSDEVCSSNTFCDLHYSVCSCASFVCLIYIVYNTVTYHSY